MQLLSDAMSESIGKGSMIRRMFEAGIALKKEHGEDAVCDFSLGNPDLPPPPAVAEGLRKLAGEMDRPFALGYMPNGGFPWARKMLAGHLSKEQGTPLEAEDVILTCGAAGGLNSLFKAVLNPGDEVLAPAPCFVEYGAYAANHGGVFRTVPTTADSFELDLEALDRAVGKKTRVLILNSPNNPTGQIYSLDSLKALAALLEEKSRQNGRPIFLAVDEPYRFLAYDGAQAPSLLPLYAYAVVASSFSKSLSMPGERVGYLALSPLMPGRGELADALVLANRILGFVNPPVLGQHLMAAALGSSPAASSDPLFDASVYERRRNAMAEVLHETGYDFMLPRGAFYFFPKAPGGDDVAFCERLSKQLVLGVPGSAFMGPGHFRLAFCVDEAVIYRAKAGLRKART